MTTGQGGTSSGKGNLPAADQREIEWQLDAADLDLVGGWLGKQPSGSSGLVVDPEPTVEITDAYYDTEDWRLYRAGYTLRVRETEGAFEATMKSLTTSKDSLKNRREISEPLRDDAPARLGDASGPVGKRSRQIIGGHGLRRLFLVRTRRRRFSLLPGGSDGEDRDLARAGEVSLDASEIPVDGELVFLRLEFFSEVYGKPVQKLVEPLKALQDDLGEHQDAVVAAGYLRELGTTTGGTRVPRGAAFTMGVYSERCASGAKNLRRTVPGSKPFRALEKGKKWRKFEKVLEDQNRAYAPDESVR